MFSWLLINVTVFLYKVWIMWIILILIYLFFFLYYFEKKVGWDQSRTFVVAWNGLRYILEDYNSFMLLDAGVDLLG